jgi:5-(carboxyamino)imidazole ribonucleotide synthase
MQQVKGDDLTIHILGGGQLGKMLIEAASDWNVRCHVLDPDPDCSCARMAWQFTCGDFRDYQTVMDFCADAHFITIEIEHVNTKALEDLRNMGKRVMPDAGPLAIIKDKGKQKRFYHQHDIPTSPFRLFDTRDELLRAINNDEINLPFVQKSCTAGYDGRGVLIVREKSQLDQLLDGPSLAEELVPFEKELAVIVARDSHGSTVAFPAVEMEFHPTANLVEMLLSPAHISTETEQRARQLAADTIVAYGLEGLLAVEMFLTSDGELLVNEVAPRPHNSGHHTIEANITSQYQQLLRCMFGLPLGSTTGIIPAVMVNLLGEAGYTGNAVYEGMPECLAQEGVYIHLYGKKITKPFRKMGHVTITDSNAAKAHEKAQFVKSTLKIKA